MSEQAYYGLKSIPKSGNETFYLNEVVEFISNQDQYKGIENNWKKGVVKVLRQPFISYYIGIMHDETGTPVTQLNAAENNEEAGLWEKDFQYIRKIRGDIHMENPFCR